MSTPAAVPLPKASFAQNLRGAGLLALTMGLFSLSDVLIKVVVGVLPIGQTLLLRGGLICAILAGTLAVRGRLGALARCAERLNLLRAVVEVVVAYTFFMGLRYLPLATATTILFAAPIIMTGASAAFLGERVGWQRWAAVLVGFSGVLVVARPGTGDFGTAALWPLAAAFLVAARDLMTRYLPRDLEPAAAALTTAAAVTAGGAVGTAVMGFVVPSPAQLLAVAASAVLIAAGYVTIVLAFRLGEVSFMAPFRYVAIPLTMVLGLAVWGERPDLPMLVGAALIVGAGVFIFHRERALARRSA